MSFFILTLRQGAFRFILFGTRGMSSWVGLDVVWNKAKHTLPSHRSTPIASPGTVSGREWDCRHKKNQDVSQASLGSSFSHGFARENGNNRKTS